MLGLPAAALLVLLGRQFDINGSVTVEGRAGEAPLNTQGSIEAGVAGILMPDLQLSYLSRITDARIDYSARIFWRKPNEANTSKPVILHVVNLGASSQATPRLLLTANGNMSVGEADYTALGAVLPNQPALPSVVDFLSITGGVGAQEALSRRAKIGLNLSLIHRRPLGETAGVTEVPGTLLFPHQTTGLAEPNFRYTLSRRDDLTVTSPVSYGRYTGGDQRFEIFLASPQVGWQHRLTRRYSLRVAAGLAYVHVVPSLNTQSPVSPVGEVGVDMQLAGHGGLLTRGSAGVRLDYFVDPVLGTAGPRASLALGITSILNPSWLVGAEATYATVFTGSNPQIVLGDPQGGAIPPIGGATVPVDETLVAAAILARCRVSDALTTEFGFRYSDRAPSLQVSAFGFHQRQLWLYGSFTASTRRPTSRMVK